MARKYKPVDLSGIRTYSVAKRQHKMVLPPAQPMGALLPSPGASARQLLESLPDFLGAKAFRAVVKAIVNAVNNDRPVVFALGAHVIKVGCSPIIVDLIQRGVVRAVAGNGATAIHDVEVALIGQTSEEVADTIRDGSFGMVAETMQFFDEAVMAAAKDGIGLGEAVGRLLVQREAIHLQDSIFATAYQKGIPICAHVAIGTDTIHMSGGISGEALGASSLHDFRLICDVVSDLGATSSSSVGGVWVNIGSAVIMPEVFLKAVSVARNLGADLSAMVTANFDMIRHYRPRANVVTRPVSMGQGYEVVGQHEILLPLLRQAILEKLEESRATN